MFHRYKGKALRAVELETIFKRYSAGVATGRDSIVYNFECGLLGRHIKQFIEDYNAEVSRWVRGGRLKDIDNFVFYDKVKWSRNLKRDLRNEHYIHYDANAIRRSLYRPFTQMCLYYADIIVDELGTLRAFFPTPNTEIENRIICLTDLGSEKPFMVLVSNSIPDRHLVGAGATDQCFPFYTYAEDGSNRSENITDWALAQCQAKYGEQVSKWDIFHYVYAMLHHPGYRERYAENLKRELPRIPLLKERAAFETCVRIGKLLMELHLNYEQAEEYPLTWVENKDVPVSWRVEKMKLTPGKDTLVVNEWLTLSGIPQECSAYRLGNRSALEWVIDQYQVSEDKRSGIVSDPNQLDNEEYIVRLVGKVITVSVETVKFVKELEQAVIQEDWMSKTEEETPSTSPIH